MVTRCTRLTLGLFVMPFLAGLPYVEAQSAKPEPRSATSTPRRANGKPDLNGIWTDVLKGTGGKQGQSVVTSRLGGLLEQDGSVMRKGDRNKPMYKPEYWEKVRTLEANALHEDPSNQCKVSGWGVPRLGAPAQILHQDNLVVFLYSGGLATESVPPLYRPVPLNRSHNELRAANDMPRGDSVGRWEGDTLVVDTIALSDDAWLTAKSGYFHSDKLHVVERFTRSGDQLKYEVVVEDPGVLLEPWVWRPQMLNLNKNPDAVLFDEPACIERDADFTPVR